uniref:Transcription initiation factor IIA gamma chain n=1 Tax=Xenopus tropicalis TaxID=8364 RepID=A0A6I8SRW1_XENTR
MAYQPYRITTLGNSLQESLDELIQFQQINSQFALKFLLKFNKAINSALGFLKNYSFILYRVKRKTMRELSSP